MKYQRRRRADLSGRMLRGEDLREVDWRDAKLVGADLSGALLYGADLSNSDLSGALLVGTDCTAQPSVVQCSATPICVMPRYVP